MSHCRVLFFSSLKDCVGSGEIEWTLTEAVSVGKLYEALSEKFPALERWRPALLMAVNQTYVTAETLVHPGDEVAYMPPVQGG